MFPIIPKRISDSLKEMVESFDIREKQLCRISFVVTGGDRISFVVTYTPANLEREEAPWRFE
jgi:hypothetical protein